MSRGAPHLRQRAPASQGVADERMPAVVDGQGAEALSAQHLAGGEEPATQGVALEGLASSADRSAAQV